MNDEIKECLDSLYYQDDYSSINYDKLLDYITNLQQENEYLKKNNPEQNIEHFRIIKENKRKINNLREQNKTLQESNQNMQEEMARVWEENERLKENAIHNDKVVDKAKWNEMIYKSRCEKAIEYNNQIIKDIKGFYRPTTDIIYSGDCIIDIAKININILQNGSDKDDK